MMKDKEKPTPSSGGEVGLLPALQGRKKEITHLREKGNSLQEEKKANGSYKAMIFL